MTILQLIHIQEVRRLGIYQAFGPRGLIYAGITYRIAYEIEENRVIPLLLCGTHENFYEQLKKILK